MHKTRNLNEEGGGANVFLQNSLLSETLICNSDKNYSEFCCFLKPYSGNKQVEQKQ